MFKLSEKNLQTIIDHKIQALRTTPIEIYPYYEGLNLANIPSSICSWLSIPVPRDQTLKLPAPNIPLNKVKNVVLLLVDGLSYQRMHNWLVSNYQKRVLKPIWKQIADQAMFSPLTSVAPSTTANALTCLWTGRFPAEHGVLGYELYVPEYKKIMNMILQTQVYPLPEANTPHLDFDISHFLPVQTLGTHFRQHNVEPYAFQHNDISGSGLSRMLLQDVNRVPFRSLDELWRKVNELLDSPSSKKRYIYLYWSALDTISHRQGPDGRKTRNEWRWFSHLLEQFMKDRYSRDAQDTVLIVTSDHGQIPVEIQPKYEVRNDQQFLQNLEMPPSGESRFPYLFMGPEKMPAFKEYVAQRWPNTFSLLPIDDMVSAGIFGEKDISTKIRSRLGNLTALPKGDAYWWWAQKENHLLGRHGGFSAEEMITPLLILPL